MRVIRYLAVLPVILVAVSARASVTVVATFPPNGAKDVDASITQFQARFSDAVSTGGCSFVNTQYGEPVKSTGAPTYSNGDTVCTLPITLRPGVKYSVSINGDRFTNFRSASSGEPVTPYPVVFTTAAKVPVSAPAPVKESRQVTVVSTYPKNDDTKVDPRLAAIRVRFSEAVGPRGCSFEDTDKGAPMPLVGTPVFTDGNKLCTYAVKLEPGTSYAVDIYSAGPGVPVTQYLLKFKTSGKLRKKAGMTTQKWQEDLSYLGAELPKLHKNLFAKITKEQWKDNVGKLNNRIPTMSEAEILVGLTTLFASIGDPHTTINVLGSNQLSVLPMQTYWFKDGVYVTAASDTCKDTLGCQVLKIGGVDVDKACDALSSTFAHDSQSACKLLEPIYLSAPDFLKSVGVVTKVDEVALTLKDKQGNTTTAAVRSIKLGSGLERDLKSVLDGKNIPVPLCRKNPGLPYWTEYVENDRLVYFQYNTCSDDPDHAFGTVRSEVEKLLAKHTDARLVIDLRNNGGGSSEILDPFIDSVRANHNVNRRGRLFVITGRRTFSSAILNTLRLRNETNAVLVGEPTGASPNGYGEVRHFKLLNSGLTVRYSTKYFKCSDKDVDAIEPDVTVEPTYNEFAHGEDPVMDAIVGYKADQ